MHRIFIALVLLIGLIFNMCTYTFAYPCDDINKELHIDSMSYKELQDKLEEMEINIEKMDSRIEEIYREIEEVDKSIEEQVYKVEKTEKVLNSVNEELESVQDLFNKRIRALYINGKINYLQIIFESNGLEDFINNLEIIKEIMEYDQNIINDLKAKKIRTERENNILEKEVKQLLMFRNNRENKLSELEKSKKEQKIIMLEMKRQHQLYCSNNKYNEEIRKNEMVINETIMNIEKLMVNFSSTSKEAISISPEAIITYAAEFLGKPYVYGGNGPNYFDCSGFVKYVYLHFGIELSRTTYTQVREGKYIPRDELQLGDLVFFGTPYNVHHVGIYVGNNCYMHAPHTGDKVKISILTRKDYVCARRVY